MSHSITRPELDRTRASIESLLQTISAADNGCDTRERTQCLWSISQALRDFSKQCRESAEETRAMALHSRSVHRDPSHRTSL